MKKRARYLITLCLIVGGIPASAGETPDSVVLLIIDGLGSYYIYPEFMPHTLSGTPLEKIDAPNLIEGDARVINIRVPVPMTGPGHSVIVTGDPAAEPDTLPITTTIFDILHDEGFIALAVMEKGDFSGMRREQDAILYAESNSIDEPVFKVEHQHRPVPTEIIETMEERCSLMPEYMRCAEGAAAYQRYNRFAIETAEDLVEAMTENHPDQRFILTINVGGVDSVGHHTNHVTYLQVIEGVDSDIKRLKDICEEKKIAFILTGDHGMSFKTPESRGGHAGDDYKETPESIHTPLVMSAPNISPKIISGDWGQENIAPTILSILDLPNLLSTDSKPIPIKKYANLYVITDADSVKLYQDEKLIGEEETGRIRFKDLNGTYRILATSGETRIEKTIAVTEDRTLTLNMPGETTKRAIETRHAIGIILILLINTTGIILIKRITR